MKEFNSTTKTKGFRNSCISILLTFASLIVYAQENTPALCANGIDDDGDGLIDCFDNECSTVSTCDDFFFGKSVVCYGEIEVENFSIRQQWSSADETATSHTSPVIGDLDQNGIPEVVTINNYGNTITVLNGANGAVQATRDVGFNPENTPAIANVFRDETTEILVTENEGREMVLFSGDLNNEIWRVEASRNDMGIAGFADFNEDGIAEIYYKNEIINAETGAIIITGNGDWERDYVHGPIAIDVLPATDPDCIAAGGNCNGLELVTGNHVWAIDIANGTRVAVKNMNDVLAAQGESRDYFPKYWGGWLDGTRSTVSTADYNLDGNIDVLMSGALGNEGTDQTTLFFWDVTNEVVTMYTDPANDFERGPGRINIGDVDGDGQLNANFVMDQRLYSLDENFNIHWVQDIKEGSSGFTGCTLFDFDGDGTVETVYRSEESILILEGQNGNTVREIICVSRTQEEYPVVADVDGDGASEICVACYTNDNTNFSPYSNTQFSHIRVFESNGEAWMPSRSVWNQHGYFNVNINDDLTVPIELQDHSVVFSDGICEYADGTTIPFPSRPLNTFLTQAPLLDANGCFEVVNPDLVISTNPISAMPAVCPDSEVQVTFTLTNEGDLDISGDLPISYYAEDPLTGAATLLDTETESLLDFQVGESREITHMVNGTGGEYTLFVVINDMGSTPPIAASLEDLPAAVISECETSNNINSVAVTFQPFSLTTEILDHDRRCDISLQPDGTPTITPNGSARVFYFGPTPGLQEFIYQENFEDLTNGTTSDAGTTAWTSSSANQTPVFFGINDFNGTKMFEATGTGTGSGEVTWSSQAIDISDHTDISVTMDLFEEGDMEIASEGGSDLITVAFEIRDRSNTLINSGVFPTGGSIDGNFIYAQAELTGLRPNDTDADSLLIITVTMQNTTSTEHHYIDNILVQGQQEDIIKRHTEADGFEFRWYNAGDYSTVLYTGSTYTQMPFGTYEVIASFPGTGCISDTVQITIENRNGTSTPPHLVNAWIYELSPLSDCITPNGSLAAFAYTQTQNGTFPATNSNIPLDTLGIVDGYTFTWRLTNDATNTVIGSGETLFNLTNQSYTVDVLEGFSGCTTSAAETVSSGLTFPPAPNVTVVNINSCGGSGTLTADVNGNTSDFLFEWFDGPSIKPVPDFTGVTYLVNNVGEYTVRATQISSSCPSDTTTATVEDDSSSPTASLSLIQDNTFCTGGSGTLEADGDGAGTVIGYSFAWYKGANTLSENSLPGSVEPTAYLVSDNAHQLGGLTEGTYRVVVTNNSTNCTDTLDQLVQNVPSTVSISGTPSITHISGCNTNALGAINALGLLPGGINTVSAGNINEGFEAPLTTDASLRQRGPGSGREWAYFFQEDVPGWSTTATDNFIEFWSDQNTRANGTQPFEGNQFAELNAEQVSTLYFDLPTNPGSFFEWSFYHRGRLGVDEIGLNIGDPNSTIRQSSYATDNTAWEQYSGTYTIPPGQFVTRFEFESVSTSTGSAQLGNFLDLVQFQLPAYRFELFEGTTASGVADFINTTGEFSDLPEGTYTLVIYDNESGCNAAEIPIVIDRIEEEPQLSTSLTADLNCVGASGSVAVTSLMPTIGEPSSYTYRLFNGQDTLSQNGSNVNVPDGSIGHTFDNLENGDYRVMVINNLTQCFAFEDISILDETFTPLILSSSTTPNFGCVTGNGNGSARVEVDRDGDSIPDDENDFQFTWYDGPNTSSPVLAQDVQGLNIISQNTGFSIDGGSYTVIARNIATGCETAPRTISVDDTPYIPTIVIEEVSPQTDCGPGNGSLRAYVTNDPNGLICPGGCELAEGDGFTFQWSQGGTPLADGAVINGSDSSIISGISAGGYQVEAILTNLGCSATASFTLSENQTLPILSLSSSQNNATCDSSNYTGSLTVAVAFGTLSPVVDLTGYTFTWYNGSGASKTLNTSSTTETLSGIDEGGYSVTVQAPNACTSDTIVLSIIDALPVVDPVPSAQSENTVCDPTNNGTGQPDANGSITFTPTTDGTTGALYSFALTTSGGVAIDNAGGTIGFGDVNYATNTASTTVTGLPQGSYTMEVSDDNNTCSITHNFIISDDFTNPVIQIGSITTQPNTTCDPANYTGQADATDTAAVTGGSGNYRFEWARDSDPTTVIDNDAILDMGGTGVIHGNYILTVIDDVTGCTSAAQSITINENIPAIPIITTLLSIDYSCSPATPTGSINAAVSGGSTGYTLEWYSGTSATGSILNSTTDSDNTLSNLAPGNYTVRVIDNSTRCSETQTIEVIEDNPTVGASITKNQDQDQCLPANGRATVTPSVSFTGTDTTGFSVIYAYQWYSGPNAIPANELTSQTSALLDSVTAGFYTVVVTETTSGCTSAPETVEILDVTPTPPSISFTADVIPGACDTQGGEISATLSGGTGPFTFFWYEGAGDFANNDPSGLNALTSGVGQLVNDPTANIVVNTSSPSPELDNIVNGIYTLVVADDAGCRHQETFGLAFDGVQAHTTMSVTDMTQCPGNGEVRVALADNIELTISSATGTFLPMETFTAAPSGATGLVNFDDASGTLQAVVTSGAFGIGDVITGDITGFTATVDNISNQTRLAGEEDDIEQYVIYLYAGSGVPTDRFATYPVANTDTTFTFPLIYDPTGSGDVLDGTGANIFSSPGTISTTDTAVFSNLPAGPYTAIAWEKATAPFSTGVQCWSIPVTDTLIQEAYRPIISTATITDDTFCTIGTGNGSIDINAIKNTDDVIQPNDFQFELFDFGMNTLSNTTNATSATFANLDAGTYFVTVTRLGLGGPSSNSCDTTAMYVVPEDQEIHEISNASITHNDDCNPLNGAASISDADITDNVADYVLTWYVDNAGTNVLDISDVPTVTFPGNPNGTLGANSIATVPAGTYYVQGLHNTKGCLTPLFEVVINDERVIPIVQVVATAEDIVCDDANFVPTGQATAQVVIGGVTQDPNNYLFTWFLDDIATDTIDASDAGLSNAGFRSTEAGNTNTANNQAGVNIIDSIPQGSYYVVATDITNSFGCQNSPAAEVVVSQFNTSMFVGSIQATDFNFQDVDDCNPLNGSYEILRVSETRPGPSTIFSTNMTDYTFTWFESNGVDTLGNLTTSATFPNAANGTPGASAVNNLPQGTYFVQISNSGVTGCVQASDDIVQFTIGDNTGVISITRDNANSSEDTFCDHTAFSGDGTLAVNIVEDGLPANLPDYTITWYRGSIAIANVIFPNDGGNRGSATNLSGDLTRLGGLATGDYVIEAVKNAGPSANSGCIQTAVLNVGSMDNIPVLDEASIQARASADSLCGATSGSITLLDGDIADNDAATDLLSDYHITVIRDVTPQDTVYDARGAASPVGITGLEAGNYFIIATDTTTGCQTATAVINIADEVQLPQIGLVRITPDQNCSSPNSSGGIEIVVDNIFDETDPRFSNPNIQWFTGADTLGSLYSGTGANTASMSDAPAGTYTVRVRNGNTGCISTDTYLIPSAPVIPSIIDATISDNTNCTPLASSGSFQLDSVLYATLPKLDTTALLANDDSLFIFMDATLTTLAPNADDDPNSRYIWEGLPAGTYFAAILRNDTKCLSVGNQFTILDNTVLPSINISLTQADSSCVGGTSSGALVGRVLVNGTPIPASSFSAYTFEWFEGSGTGGTALGGTSALTGLAAETYTLQVTLDSTGCTSIAEFEIPRVTIPVEIIAAAVTPVTNCSPANGGATITTMSRDNPADYTFEYFDTDPTANPTPTALPIGNGPADLIGQEAGIYYVIATHNTLNCTTPAFQIEILENITRPVVALDDFEFQTNCYPGNPNGSLTIRVDGSTTPSLLTYTIEWFEGSDASGVPLAGQDSARIDSIGAGFYTARVTIDATGCFTDYTAEMTDLITPIELFVSSSGNTVCENPNGSAAVSVINPGTRALTDYLYLWYAGDVANPDPADSIFSGSLMTGLAEGEYTVLVIDTVDSFCQTASMVVRVEDLTSPPRYLSFDVSPVTVCFEDSQNGSATLAIDSLDTRNENVIVEWLDVDNNLISTNSTFLGSLNPGPYKIRLTNSITGCFTEKIFDIVREVDAPEAPTVFVYGERTSCSTANGIAVANSGGIRQSGGLRFEWFNVNDLTTAYAEGDSISFLDSATYLVRATNIATGCQSPFTEVSLDYEISDIVFEMDVSIATCSRTTDGAINQFNTLIRVNIDNESNPVVLPTSNNLTPPKATNFEWRDANGTIIETESDQLIDVAPGDYSVTFTARNGCTYSSNFSVTTDIKIYNGLSPNDDRLNDFLLLDCIDYFAENNVKIFNRDGVKVYEIDGYDNVNKRFEGFSNVGRSGLNLPTGTYFGIVDLNDGRDPIQFYLELVR